MGADLDEAGVGERVWRDRPGGYLGYAGRTNRRPYPGGTVVGIGGSVFLIAVGAILTFAIETDSAEGFNINTVGIILMVAGAIGLVMFALVFGRRDRVVDGGTTVVEERRLR